MNDIATKTRNWLPVKTISNLLFLCLVGAPQANFEPAKYGKEWLNCYRNADNMRESKVSMIFCGPGLKLAGPDWARAGK